MEHPLASYHPAVSLAFFVGAVILAIVVQHPLFQAVGLACATILYLSMRKRAALGFLGALGLVFVAVAMVNPLFNTAGDTVLCTLFGRPYTLEALAYGASTAAMFVTTVLWLCCYTHVMTSDRFTYLFGAAFPAITLLLTMVMRLVPTYRRKASQVVLARTCIGRSAMGGGLRSRVRSGADALSALTSWVLEGSVVTADSMRCRGYGLGRRSSYARHRVDARTIVLGAILVVSFAVTCSLVACGAAPATYLPGISIPPLGTGGLVALLAFALYVSMPLVVCVKEGLAWRLCASRI